MSQPKLRDLVGFGEARDAAIGIIADLAAWRRGTLGWEDICHGLLFCGQPSMGKTELARTMARDGGVGFVAASYADWQARGHLGHFLAAMAASFAGAQRAAPAILFLDELDAFGSRSGERVRGNHNKSYDAKAITGLLQHLDGIAGREGVVVIAACNHPEHLDPAIRRARRFDRILYIAPPGRKDLAVILRQHLGSDLPDAGLGRLAARAEGKTGADCAAAVRVARAAARQQRRTMVEDDLREALIGREPDLAPNQLWRIAIHEAGHAILHMALGTATPISLSIDSKGGSCRSRRHERANTADHLRRLRITHLAGRAAERLILGDIDTGSGGPPESDLALATRLALAEETSFGLGLLGPLWLAANLDPVLLAHLPAEVQRSIRARLIAEEAEAGRVLAANRALLVEIAHMLERTRFLDRAHLDSLLAGWCPCRQKKPRQRRPGQYDTAGIRHPFPPSGLLAGPKAWRAPATRRRLRPILMLATRPSGACHAPPIPRHRAEWRRPTMPATFCAFPSPSSCSSQKGPDQ